MKKYKRLTKVKSTSENTKFVYNENGFVIMSKELVDMLLQEHNCLWEIENKIENGTFIELPCKVGDKVYHLSDKKICEEVVKQIKYSIYNGEIDLLNSHIMTDDNYSKDYNFYRVSKLGKSLFLTKAEAEAKLLVLQGATK